jgi:hypothetical protein
MTTMQKDILVKLASERSTPCVTISLNTHRIPSEGAQDAIEIKKLLHQAHEQVILQYGKRPVAELLEKIEILIKDIDVSHNLDSLHYFLSNDTQEIIKSPWPTEKNQFHISDRFVVKPLIKLLNRTENYLILLLSQAGVRLFHAVNDAIVEEIRNDDFPFGRNPHHVTDHEKLSESKTVDNMVREYLNVVDKAALKVHNQTNMKFVVIATADNYSSLMQVADLPAMYEGYVLINSQEATHHQLALAAWPFIQALQHQRRTEAIHEMQEAVGQGNVLTDLSEIYRAIKEGRGDLLIVHDDFNQAIKMTGEGTFDLVDDATQPDVIDDISSELAWEVTSKKGRSVFTQQDEIKELGNLVLKVRY